MTDSLDAPLTEEEKCPEAFLLDNYGSIPCELHRGHDGPHLTFRDAGFPLRGEALGAMKKDVVQEMRRLALLVEENDFGPEEYPASAWLRDLAMRVQVCLPERR